MDEQLQSEDRQNTGSVLKNSIEKLKKFIPGVRYGLLLTAAFNFSMLVVGCLNIHKCDVNKNIPLYLIVTGAVGLTSKFLTYFRERISNYVRVQYLETALYIIELILLVLGCLWVFSEFQPSYDPRDKKKYCNETAYLFAFIYLVINLIIIIATILGFVCFLGCAALLACSDKTSYDVEAQPPREGVGARKALTNAI